jgi:hypothetical protein
MAPRHTIGSKPPREPLRSPSAINRRRESSRAPSRPPEVPASGRSSRIPTVVGAFVGVALGAGGLAAVTWSSGCGSEAPPPGPAIDTTAGPLASLPEPPIAPEEVDAPVVEEPEPPDQPAEPEEEKPWEGPWLGATGQTTPIYPTARFSKNRMGYIRRGGKVPVVDKPIKTDSCKQGFYPLVDGGYVCGKYATTNIEDPRVKMGVTPPNLDALLPYRYAYNKAHGTPLYSAVPSKEEMLRYEPYLDEGKKKEKKPADADQHADEADKPRPDSARGKTEAAKASEEPSPQFLIPDAQPNGAPSSEASVGGAPPAPESPWWQQDKGDVQVKLDDLEESDGTLQKRMVKGFFISIDRTFGWNNRMWYKATDGLIAPADRMIIPKAPELKGLEMGEGVKQVGFVLWRKANAFRFSSEDAAPKRGDALARYQAVGLTGKTRVHDKQRYRETTEGWWLKEEHGTHTDPGPRPDEVGADEKWIDVNLTRKTLVAFVGDRPVYAALISPGKRSANKAKDHRTKVGKWRVREKHIAATMDGDGPAGDLPYSIQDVPFVQYYDGSYALHGAFWHDAFGQEKSHGCVNLSPHDAKFVFFFTEPSLPRGWHGVFASDKRKGSLVVVHE